MKATQKHCLLHTRQKRFFYKWSNFKLFCTSSLVTQAIFTIGPFTRHSLLYTTTLSSCAYNLVNKVYIGSYCCIKLQRISYNFTLLNQAHRKSYINDDSKQQLSFRHLLRHNNSSVSWGHNLPIYMELLTWRLRNYDMSNLNIIL